jgi:RNA polymerase sigma-70 factor (ECF subfamily)
MMSAFRRAGSFRGDAAVTTWLHRIVVNACLDRLRRRGVRSALPLPEDEPAAAVPALVDAGDPAEAAVRTDRAERLLAALAMLPIEQRAALVLVDMHGCSVEEAAAILEVPPGTVKSRCSRGRARLLPLLEPLRERNQEDGERVPTVGGGDQP